MLLLILAVAVADGRFDQKKIEQYALCWGRLERDGERSFYAMKSGQDSFSAASHCSCAWGSLNPGRELAPTANARPVALVVTSDMVGNPAPAR